MLRASRRLALLAVFGLFSGGPAWAAAGRVEIVPQLAPDIYLMTFSADDKFVVTAGDREADLWDVPTRRLMRSFKSEFDIRSIAASPDGTMLATGGSDGSLRLWSMETGAQILILDASSSSSIDALAFTHAGDRLVASDSSGAITVWSLADNQIISAFGQGSQPTQSLSISPNDNTVLAGGIAWSLDGKSSTTLPGQGAVFSPDGRSVAVIADGFPATDMNMGSGVEILSTATGQVVKRFGGSYHAPTSLSFSADGTELLAMDDQTEEVDDVLEVGTVWSVVSGDIIARVKGPGNNSYGSGSFSHDGKIFGVASKRRVDLVKADGTEVGQLSGNTQAVSSLEILGGSNVALEASGSAYLRDLTTGEIERRLGASADVFSASISTDGAIAALGTSQGVSIVDGTTSKLIRTIPDTDLIRTLISPDGRLVAALDAQGDSGTSLGILSTKTGKKVATIDTGFVGSFSPDSSSLVTTSSDRVSLYSMKTGKAKWSTPTGTTFNNVAAFSADGGQVAVGLADGRVLVLRASDGAIVRTFSAGPTADGESLTAVAFSPDGSAVAGGDTNGDLRVYDVQSGHLTTLLGHSGAISSVRFSPDNTRLITASFDGTVRIWDIQTDTELARLLVFDNGQGLTITPAGYYSGTDEAAQHLAAVQGLTVNSIDQLGSVLYRPDLVQANLAGDPDALYRNAVKNADIASIMSTGAPPVVHIIGLEQRGTNADTSTVNIDVDVRAGGLGKIVVLESGSPVAVLNEAPVGGGVNTTRFSRVIPVQNGDNDISVVAYNAKGVIVSTPVTTSMRAVVQEAPPNLYVLAVGINRYADDQLTLRYSVADARSIADVLNQAGRSLFSKVVEKRLLDSEVTRANLNAAFADLAAEVRPKDVFILYFAGHGVTQDGTYYYVPADFQYTSADAITAQGIDAGQIQAWMTSVPARKSVLLLDTCESGSMGQLAFAARGITEKVAIERLNRAIGRS